MSTMIQVRNVPEEIHRKLKARAALAGLSLSEYILQELKRDVERSTREELLDRIGALGVVELARSPAELIRAERDRQ